MIYEYIIIGAGASGMLSAIRLAKKGCPVLLIDKNYRVGMKLSATGNGRCNYTNLNMSDKYYYGDKKWIRTVLSRVTPEDVVNELRGYGILPREERGYIYPHTNQASTVVRVLSDTLLKSGVKIMTECEAQDVIKVDDKIAGFRVITSKGEFLSQRLIMATGGAAGVEQGGSYLGYGLIKKLGHSITGIYPGLTGLICEGNVWKRVAGTRVRGEFSLIIDGKRIYAERGEIQITKTGVSGIPVFQLCHPAAKALAEGKEVRGCIDFVPDMTDDECREWIDSHGISGLVQAKWESVLDDGCDMDGMVERIKRYTFVIRNTLGIERAQVSAGGVPTSEVSPDNFKSGVVPGLYITGEMVDVDGLCGGYNLHMAFASAMIATGFVSGG